MNRQARRALARRIAARDKRTAPVLRELADYARRRIDLARTMEPRAAADDLYNAARDYRRQAQEALNRGDESGSQALLVQAQGLEDAASSFTVDL